MEPMETDWIIRWPDGSTSAAHSAYDLLAKLGASQHDPCSHQDMKIILSNRAMTWSGKFIHYAQPDVPFLRELARVGMITIESEGPS